MTFYVIGNGFDLHYGLKTRYDHFKSYLINNGYSDLIDRVDDLFYRIGGFDIDEITDWSKFEDMLVVFNNLDPDEIYDEAMENAETDDDRAGYWDSPSWNVGFYNEYIQTLKQEFDVWIENINTRIVPDNYFMPKKKDFILTFNYTTTIEDNYDFNPNNIIHIHGTVGQEIILGHNEFQEPYHYHIIEDEESDYRDVTTRKAVNEVLDQAAIEYYKNSPAILEKYSSLFKQIPKFEKVVLIGLSCGPQDKIYIHEILKYTHNIEFFYYDLEARENFEWLARNFNGSIKFIKW